MDALSPDTPTTSEASEALLTASQLARRFAVSRNWVYQAVADDVLPHRRRGEDGPIRFVAAEIDQWLDAQRRGWMPGSAKNGKRGAR
jgi:predicted DNA-binding transcriptional regulator AlpA